jgi:hypothetical protein
MVFKDGDLSGFLSNYDTSCLRGGPGPPFYMIIYVVKSFYDQLENNKFALAVDLFALSCLFHKNSQYLPNKVHQVCTF